jgi:hypothetical protein
MSDNIEILRILDAPQLAALAPELMQFLPPIQEIGRRVSSADCTTCARNAALVELQVLARRIQDVIDGSPALRDVIPTLMQAALQAARPVQE